jgi:hypothetical protein
MLALHDPHGVGGDQTEVGEMNRMIRRLKRFFLGPTEFYYHWQPGIAPPMPLRDVGGWTTLEGVRDWAAYCNWNNVTIERLGKDGVSIGVEASVKVVSA